jgi:hypothetical protein
MADHIFGFGKKVITDELGTLYDSGGPNAPYNLNEEDYFVIRRTAAQYAANDIFVLNVVEWNVRDYHSTDAPTDYDYIDVYVDNNDGLNPALWVWSGRIGGEDINTQAGNAVNEWSIDARNLKLVFRSSYRQDYNNDGGFKINFFVQGTVTSFEIEAVSGPSAGASYADQFNLKENAGDSLSTVQENLTEDLAKNNWDFVPVGQFDSNEARNGINTLNYEFTNFNYIRQPGVKLPLSYVQPERSFARLNTGTVSKISREDD